MGVARLPSVYQIGPGTATTAADVLDKSVEEEGAFSR